MQRTCLRCSHLNAVATGATDEACPACGAVYRKVEAYVNEHGVLALQERVHRQSRPPDAAQRAISPPQAEPVDGTTPPVGRYVCLSCNSRFNQPKLKGNGWIELILYFLVAIVGGFIYSIWRRTGQNKECPQCGSRAFKLASEIQRSTPPAQDSEVRVPCPDCKELILQGARKCKHCGSMLA